MPKSRSRRKPGGRPSYQQRSQQQVHPVSARKDRTPSIWRRRIGWPLCFGGLALFLAGNIGARTGIVILPFDPHHVIAQFGGGVLAGAGLLIATGR